MADSVQDGENELTMFDVLEEQQELEDDANAVLGDSDDTNCTYNEGYVPRQALYACATCKFSGEPAGICLACSYACHEGHELIELYTKRNFRCDCGNKKFIDSKCSLCPNKDDVNSKNKYNQNFGGLYCSCNRPYPDLLDCTPDEMIQCVICEDWFHCRHVGGKVPVIDGFCEIICAECTESHTFLYPYLYHFKSADQDVDVVNEVADTVRIVKTEPVEASKMEADDIGVNYANKEEVSCAVKQENPIDGDHKNNVEEIAVKSVVKQEFTTQDNVDNHCIKTEINAIKQEPLTDDKQIKCEIKREKKECVLKNLSHDADSIWVGPAFLPENWRKELCRCSDCMILYEKESCTFLLDEADTIKAYEERGKRRSGDESQYDRGLSALSQLDRVKQMEAIREYNNMKGELKDYLKQFADSKRTVSERDIKDFFEGMKGRKRQRVDTVPYFCR